MQEAKRDKHRENNTETNRRFHCSMLRKEGEYDRTRKKTPGCEQLNKKPISFNVAANSLCSLTHWTLVWLHRTHTKMQMIKAINETFTLIEVDGSTASPTADVSAHEFLEVCTPYKDKQKTDTFVGNLHLERATFIFSNTTHQDVFLELFFFCSKPVSSWENSHMTIFL